MFISLITDAAFSFQTKPPTPELMPVIVIHYEDRYGLLKYLIGCAMYAYVPLNSLYSLGSLEARIARGYNNAD
jgi:hypothetical protein